MGWQMDSSQSLTSTSIFGMWVFTSMIFYCWTRCQDPMILSDQLSSAFIRNPLTIFVSFFYYSPNPPTGTKDHMNKIFNLNLFTFILSTIRIQPHWRTQFWIQILFYWLLAKALFLAGIYSCANLGYLLGSRSWDFKLLSNLSSNWTLFLYLL